MINKKIDEKEANELGEFYNLYLEKRKEIMKSTQIKFEDVFGDIICEKYYSPEQRTKLNIFLANIMWILIFV